MTCAAWVQVLVFTQSVNWSYHEDFSNEFNPRYSSHDIYDVHWFRFVCLFVNFETSRKQLPREQEEIAIMGITINQSIHCTFEKLILGLGM